MRSVALPMLVIACAWMHACSSEVTQLLGAARYSDGALVCGDAALHGLVTRARNAEFAPGVDPCRAP